MKEEEYKIDWINRVISRLESIWEEELDAYTKQIVKIAFKAWFTDGMATEMLSNIEKRKEKLDIKD